MRLRVPSCQDSGKIQAGSTDIQVRLIHPTDRAPGTDTRILRSEANEPPKKNEGVHKQPLWNRSERFRFPGQPAERPEHSAEGAIAMQDSRMFGRMLLQAFPSGQPDLQPFRNKTRNGPSAAGIMSRRRNETEKEAAGPVAGTNRPRRIRRIRTKRPCIAARLLTGGYLLSHM